MGLVYVLHWPLFPATPNAAYIAASIPFALTLAIGSVGLGLREDKNMVVSLSRSGKRTDLLVGPLTYGLAMVASTVCYWR